MILRARKSVEDIKELMNISEAAKYMNVSVSTIRRWDDLNKLKSIRHPINNYRMYRVKDLDEILDQLQEKNG